MTMEKNMRYLAEFIRNYGNLTKGGAYTVDMGEIPFKRDKKVTVIRKMSMFGKDIYLTYSNGVKGKPNTERIERFADTKQIAELVKIIKFYDK